MSAPHPRKARPNGAFTLIELMVSSALIGIIMMVLLATTTTSLGLWRNAETRITVEREGRNAIALISEDLRGMTMLPEPAAIFPVGSDDFGTGVADNSVFMEFFTLRPNDYQRTADDKGDICYVRYRFRDNKIERAVADSRVTFAALRDKTRPATGEFEMLADNIPGGNLWVYARNSEGKVATSVSNAAFISVSFGVVDVVEMENMKRGISLPNQATSQQYFSSRIHLTPP